MRYLCKITKTGNQKRISLPIGFLKNNNWEDAEFLLIDDKDRKSIVIRRFVHEKSAKGNS